MGQFIDLTGQKFGRLTVLERVNIKAHKYASWLCKCSCGKVKVVRSCHLRSGVIVSCGCYQKEIARAVNSTHKASRTRLYTEWNHMKIRCYCKSYHAYNLYGGRGISVCEEWKNSFLAFKEWALNNGYSDDLTLDRIDNNKGYEPSNCRWATRYTQSNNRSIVHIVEYHGEKGVFEGMCRKLNVSQGTIRSRMKKGITFEEAIDMYKKTAPYYKAKPVKRNYKKVNSAK